MTQDRMTHPGLAAVTTPSHARCRPRIWSPEPRPLPVLRCVVADTSPTSLHPSGFGNSFPASGFDGPSQVGETGLPGKVSSMVRGWMAMVASAHARQARFLWGGAAQAKLQAALADLQENLESRGAEGVCQALMPRDPLEKQVLLHHLAQSLPATGAGRPQVLALARAMALEEAPTLAFLRNTVDAFKPLDSLAPPNTAALLRQAVHEIGASAPPPAGIRPAALAQVLLRKFGADHFDDAVRALRTGIRADLKARRPSFLGPRLLEAATDRSVFCAVKLTHRVSNDLCRRLAQLGVQGHCAATDLACALLAGAETGCGDLAALLSRYLGSETAASIQADRHALESFRAAFAVLPIALWPPSRAHRRDLLLASLDRAPAPAAHAPILLRAA